MITEQYNDWLTFKQQQMNKWITNWWKQIFIYLNINSKLRILFINSSFFYLFSFSFLPFHSLFFLSVPILAVICYQFIEGSYSTAAKIFNDIPSEEYFFISLKLLFVFFTNNFNNKPSQHQHSATFSRLHFSIFPSICVLTRPTQPRPLRGQRLLRLSLRHVLRRALRGEVSATADLKDKIGNHRMRYHALLTYYNTISISYLCAYFL